MMYDAAMPRSVTAEKEWGLLALVVTACLGLAAWVYMPAMSEYFFLFDDFKIVGQAVELSPLSLATQPHFHYFRPVVHLWFALEAVVFGWGAPSGYAWMGLALHMANALLLGGLIWRASAERQVAAVSAGVFFCAPWALETVFWVSCRFELMACFLSLLACHAGLMAQATKGPDGRAGRSRASLLTVLALVALSCLAKETAVALWLALLGAGHVMGWPTAAPKARLLARAVSATLIGYLGIRALVMLIFANGDPFGGHQGNVFALLLSVESLKSLLAHLHAIVLPPGGLTSEIFLFGQASMLILGLLSALFFTPRRACAALLCALFTLAPALWIQRDVGSMAGGRLLYLPSLFVAWATASGWWCLGARLARSQSIAALFFLIWTSTALVSADHQSNHWRAAYKVANAAMAEYAEHEPAVGPRHVENMPFMMREGPYLLKPYAFDWYRGRTGSPPTTATPVVYELRGGKARPVTRWGKVKPEEQRPGDVITLGLDGL